jgi:pyridoxal 5'-phosphate synthase pdxS subunit
MNPGNGSSERSEAQSFEIKVGLAEMLKGGVIMDVTTPDQAKIAEEAGAAAVMALERVPADIRKEGGVARMCSIEVIEGIQRTVSIPVMAKVRIGHFLEARVLESLGVDFIDESEVLTPADEEHHVAKHDFRSPFVCGARNLGEALRRIGEGAAMIRTKGEAGSGNIVEAVRHLRAVTGEIRALAALRPEEVATRAKELQAPRELVEFVAREGCLPVPNFAAGGIATPADAALCMALGRGGVRGLGHLQERGSRGTRSRRGARHHALAGPGRGARGQPRSRRGHARNRDGDARGARAAREPRLVASRRRAKIEQPVGTEAP